MCLLWVNSKYSLVYTDGTLCQAPMDQGQTWALDLGDSSCTRRQGPGQEVQAWEALARTNRGQAAVRFSKGRWGLAEFSQQLWPQPERIFHLLLLQLPGPSFCPSPRGTAQTAILGFPHHLAVGMGVLGYKWKRSTIAKPPDQ